MVVAVWGLLGDNAEIAVMSVAIGEFVGPVLGNALTGPCGLPDL